MNRTLVSLLALAPLALACQQAPLDGAWTGRARCGNSDVLKVDAMFDQRLERDDVRGVVFIEWLVELGLLGRPRFTQRGTLRDGEFDPARARVTALVKPDEAQGGGDAPEYALRATFSDDYEELEGSLDRLRGDGEVAVSCDLDLERFDQRGN
jgi:hypothetical protein